MSGPARRTVRRRCAPGAALALAVGLLATGACGVPTGGDPDPIPAADVPAALASTPAAGNSDTAPPAAGQPRVHLVDDRDVLVPRSRTVDGAVAEQLTALLDDLAGGPSAVEREQGLTTAVPAQTRLTLRELTDGTATVELAGGNDTATGQQSRRAVAQVVLTATSLPGVQEVVLVQDGAPVEAPLPSGELTTRPLTAADYADYLTAAPS